VAAAAPARAAAPLSPAVIEQLRGLPVQHDGRLMPLDTVARESLRLVTGRTAWQGEDAVATVLGWTFDAGSWDSVPLVRVGSPRLAAAAGLPTSTLRASFRDLVGNERMRALLQEASEKAWKDEPLTPVLADARQLEERLRTLQAFFRGEGILAQPVADPSAAWLPLGARDPAELAAHADNLRAFAPAGYPPRAGMQREITYNRRRPTRLAWWILLPAALAAAAAVRLDRRWLDRLAAVAIVAAFAVITWGIATRWHIAGRIPAANMYESMLFLSWGVALFAGAAALLGRSRIVVLNAAAMAALAALLVDVLPMDPFVHPVPPVLSGTPWLAIHVPIIMVGYAVCALAMLVAHVEIGVAAFAPHRRALATRLHDLLYWYLHAGSILLIAGILTGSIWAASSWGRYWGWDPKEVWSLVAFLAYMAILHARWERMVGPFGVAASSIIAFWAIIMTYVGVNFVLASGLHSYGFASSRVTQWMMGVAAVEILFLGTAAIAHRRLPEQTVQAI
jgi:ABC-type transport system involved in cytochrome c biogenesis permease subunit